MNLEEWPIRLPSYSGGIPHFSTKNEVASLIAHLQRGKHMKQCAHLSVGEHVDKWGGRSYRPACAEDSLYRRVLKDRVGDTVYEFLGCPDPCVYFRPIWREKLSTWRRVWHPLLWFNQQPWQVKVMVLLLPALLLAIYMGAIRELTELTRAIREILQ